SLCTTITKPTSGADLSVSVMAIDTVSSGANFTYSIRVHNNGPEVATGVRLTDTLPTNANFVSASPDCVNNGGVVSCMIARLGKNASATRTIVVTPTATGQVCNAVSVLANEADSRADNNSETLCTLVTAAPEPVEDFAVVKITAPATVVLTAKK